MAAKSNAKSNKFVPTTAELRRRLVAKKMEEAQASILNTALSQWSSQENGSVVQTKVNALQTGHIGQVYSIGSDASGFISTHEVTNTAPNTTEESFYFDLPGHAPHAELESRIAFHNTQGWKANWAEKITTPNTGGTFTRIHMKRWMTTPPKVKPKPKPLPKDDLLDAFVAAIVPMETIVR